MGFKSRAFLFLFLKESKRRRRKQLGKLMAKFHSQPVNLPGARSLMNPLSVYSIYQTMCIVLLGSVHLVSVQSGQKLLLHDLFYILKDHLFSTD